MQHKCTYYTALAILMLAAILFLQCNSSTHHPEKPNILMILADDMGCSDTGCYGGDVNTPNPNRLASGKGIREGDWRLVSDDNGT